MRVTPGWALSLVLLVLSVSASGAVPIPEEATGIWSLGDCDGTGLIILANSNSALAVETEETETHVAVVKTEWVAGSFVLTTEDAVNDLVLPPLTQFQRCDSLPASVSIPFAEAITIFKRFDDIVAPCSGKDGNLSQCIAVAFQVVDITGDGLFSQAELSRMLRAAGFFLGYNLVAQEQQKSAGSVGEHITQGPVFVALKDLYVSQLAGTVLAPFVASHLIQSYDFNGDGFLALGELMQDRIPETGLQGVLVDLVVRMPPGALPALLKSLPFGLDLLP